MSVSNASSTSKIDAASRADAPRSRTQAKVRHRAQLILAIRVLIFILLLGSWELAASTGLIDPFFFSKPSAIIATLVGWIRDGTSQGSLLAQIWVTLHETVLGFLIGAVLGIVLGMVLGRNKFMADVFSIYIKVANSIPRIVLGSIFVIALGIDSGSKVALAVVMVFFVVFGNAFQGVREVDKALIENARILGASRWQVTMSVVVPSAISWILASLHVSFGFALVGAVVGEFLGARQGLGLLVVTEQGLFHADGVFAAMIVLAAIALAADALLTAVERKLLKWRAPISQDVGT
ncbi:MAG TPA: ABC transporter permease [Xanthobacteraceae bacterium]|jgi:NitT/TauT family transport system permease protein|nr:ABC transporter permease [Xanthobacteraceae bacterium]